MGKVRHIDNRLMDIDRFEKKKLQLELMLMRLGSLWISNRWPLRALITTMAAWRMRSITRKMLFGRNDKKFKFLK